MAELKSGYIAILGRPNVGKSTLMNQMIGQKISITSNKPQTTRHKIQTVYTDERGQMIFLDTPGINRPKNKLGEYMLNSARSSLKDADVILWLVEPSDKIGRDEQYIFELLKEINIPVILCINKIDTIERDAVFGYIDQYRNLLDFAEIVPVSAKEGKNVDVLMEQLFKYLPYGPLYFDEDTLTDQPVKQIAAEIIREKALHCLSDEVPHGIAVVIEKFHERDRGGDIIADIEASIICEKDSHKGIIIGKGGAMLKKIGASARYDIEKLIEEQVNLKLWVKVRKEWRESDTQLKNFGYDIKNI
ncbi:MAG: GTPase Era [Parasporobacterium sp.]|nr:GTPase Era [Parasporobacterium sp.]